MSQDDLWWARDLRLHDDLELLLFHYMSRMDDDGYGETSLEVINYDIWLLPERIAECHRALVAAGLVTREGDYGYRVHVGKIPAQRPKISRRKPGIRDIEERRHREMFGNDNGEPEFPEEVTPISRLEERDAVNQAAGLFR